MIDPALIDLVQITDAQYAKEQAAFQAVVAEETSIRQEIDTLERRHAMARDTQRGCIDGHHHVGGDVLWQGWVSRARRQLQIKLAQVLVRKSHSLRHLNLAHGRKLAAESIRDARLVEAKKQLENDKTQKEESLFLLKDAQL